MGFGLLRIKLFLEWDSRIGIVMVVALLQGILGLSKLAFVYLYMKEFKVNPSFVSLADGIISLPWILKPFWGMASDKLPLFGYHRKSYLILACLVESFSMFYISLLGTNEYETVFFQLAISLALAFRSMIGEALVVEVSKKFESNPDLTPQEKNAYAARCVSYYFGTKSIGHVISSYFSGLILEFFTPHQSISLLFLEFFFKLRLALSYFYVRNAPPDFGTGHRFPFRGESRVSLIQSGKGCLQGVHPGDQGFSFQ